MEVNIIIFSPPYAETNTHYEPKSGIAGKGYIDKDGNVDKDLWKRNAAPYSNDEYNIGNLPYGEVDG